MEWRIRSTFCSGFEGFFLCLNDTVHITPSQSWALGHLNNDQDECGKELALSFKRGSPLVTNQDGSVFLTRLEAQRSEANKTFEEAEDVEEAFEEDEDWKAKILHSSKLNSSFVIFAVECFVVCVSFSPHSTLILDTHPIRLTAGPSLTPT